MFAPGIEDLAKPQWVDALRKLIAAGGMSIAQLARALGVSYMTAKQHCEELTRLGYLVKIRTPRTAVGRPEISYRPARKVECLFPSASMEFSLATLEIARQMYGENAPERILFQYFESLRERCCSALAKLECPHQRAMALAALRRSCGVDCTYDASEGDFPRLVERHHPFGSLFAKYPAALAMEVRGIAESMGTRVERVDSMVGNALSSTEYVFPDMPAVRHVGRIMITDGRA